MNAIIREPSFVSHPELAARIRTNPYVLDAAVVTWNLAAGSVGPIAYVVGEADPAVFTAAGAATSVRVTAIPLTDSGRVDFDQLRRIPLMNEHARKYVEQQLATESEDGIIHATVSLTPTSFRPEAFPEVQGVKDASAEGMSSTPAFVAADEQINLPYDIDLSNATLVSVFENTTRSFPERTCGEYDSTGTLRKISYDQLWDDAHGMLGSLQTAGAAPGDIIFVGMDGILDFLRCFWAVLLGGMTPVPLPPLTPQSFSGAVCQRVRDAATLLCPRFILCPATFDALEDVSPCFDLAQLKEGQQAGIVHAASPSDAALVLLTSGSTGIPKAVVQTHSSLLTQAACAVEALGLRSEDVSFNWLPMDHVGSIHMFHVRDLVAGIDQIHCATNDILGQPLLWLDRVEQLGATITWSPNFACGLVNQAVIDHPSRSWDLSALRLVMNSGEPIALPTAQRFEEVIRGFGAAPNTVRPAWGMSETCSAVTYAPALRRVGGSVSVGSPVPALGVRIVMSDGTIAHEGQDGELQVTGAVVTAGYLNNDEANAEAFTADGWFRTGDLAQLNDGELTITGRLKDIVIINGVGVACQALEETVERAHGVLPSFAAVVPVRVGDSEQAAVFYVANDRAGTHQETSRNIRTLLLKHQGINPAYIIRLKRGDIPKTSIGKIQRSLLAKRLAAGEYNHVEEITEKPQGNVFRRIWRLRDLEFVPDVTEPMTTLILAPTLELARQLADGSDAVLVSLADEFISRSDGSYSVRGDVYEDYLRVAQELGRNGTLVKRIIHAGAFGSRLPHTIPSSNVHFGFVQGFLSAAHTLRAFRAQSDSVKQFMVLSSGVHSVIESDVVAYERTPVSGLVRSASIEWPDLTFVHLDTELSSSAAEAARHARRELDACPQQEDVAYRFGQRYIPNLEIVRFAGEATAYDESGLAVVVGGLGGVGRHLVDQVARAGYQHILVLGRSEATPAELAALDAKATASVYFARVDVTDLDALERTISDAEMKCGDLRLLVDATGSYISGNLSSGLSLSEREMIRTKLLGSLAVGQVVSRRKQARLVRTSSAVTFFGGAGIAAYAAANWFAEGLTRAEVGEGKASECIAWSIWADTGISQGSVVRALMQRQGYTEMEPETAETFNAAYGIPGGCVYARLNPSATMVSAQLPVLAREAQNLVIKCENQSDLTLDSLHDELGNKIPIKWTDLTVTTDSERGDAASRRPFGPVEERLHRLWQQILRQADIGIDDSFFELGGSSLEGAALIALINKEMGHRFDFTDLIEFPTIRTQADAIALTQPYAGARSSECRYTGKAIRLNKSGRQPLFCVHPLFGLVYPYATLASLLPERTFFAFQASGFNGGCVIRSIEAMARCYIQEMKTIKPDGPYDLCGWSLGALVALEMAQQLVQTGERVAHLVIIDQATDSLKRFLEWQPLQIQAQRLGSILMAAGASFDPVLRGSPKDLLALRHPLVTLRFAREWMGPMLRVALVNRQAGISYKLKRYPGAIDLLYTGDPEFTAIRDERLGWDRIADGGVRVQRLPGSHLTLHELPYVQFLADGIRSILE